MQLEFDEAKRRETLRSRGLDFEDARQVFRGFCLTIEDDRFDYGEVRFQTLGMLELKVVMIVWTVRGTRRRIISMRMGHDHERERYHEQRRRF